MGGRRYGNRRGAVPTKVAVIIDQPVCRPNAAQARRGISRKRRWPNAPHPCGANSVIRPSNSTSWDLILQPLVQFQVLAERLARHRRSKAHGHFFASPAQNLLRIGRIPGAALACQRHWPTVGILQLGSILLPA
jgi:hypothetical protein